MSRDRADDLDAWDSAASAYAEQPQVDWFDEFLTATSPTSRASACLTSFVATAGSRPSFMSVARTSSASTGAEPFSTSPGVAIPEVTFERVDPREEYEAELDAVVALMVLDIPDLSNLKLRTRHRVSDLRGSRDVPERAPRIPHHCRYRLSTYGPVTGTATAPTSRPARTRPPLRTQHRLAVAIGVPPRRINEIVHGKRGITADTALRLARYFGTSERFWLNLQSRYELEIERDRLAGTLDQIEPLVAG